MATTPLILFYGDSRAADWPNPALPGVRFANRGIPGDDTAGALRRFSRDVATLAPAIIVLQLGINDLTQAIYNAPQHPAEIMTTSQANLRQIVVQAINLDITVILTTIFPPAADLWSGWSDDHHTLCKAVNRANQNLRQLAGKQVILFETEPLLADHGRLKPEYALDMLHLNRAGYSVLNQALSPLLAALNHKSEG